MRAHKIRLGVLVRISLAVCCVVPSGAAGAVSFGFPFSPDADAPSDGNDDDLKPHVAVAGSTWVAAWNSFETLVVSRSTDGGASWSPPLSLGLGDRPSIAADTSGNWMIVAQSTDDLGGTIDIDDDILFTVSADDGVSWSSLAPVNTNAGIDVGRDSRSMVATDAIGAWVVVWESDDSLGGTIGGDLDVLYARSTDNGATWSAVAPIDSVDATDDSSDTSADVSTDGVGRWLVAWESTSEATGIREIKYTISDDGSTWAPGSVLNTNSTELGGNFRPEVANDGSGNWVAVWIHDTPNGPGFIGDIVTARSADNGATWTPTVELHPHFSTDRGDDERVELVTDHSGDWVAVWHSGDRLDGTLDTDFDILISRSRDDGATWSSPSALTPTARGEEGGGSFPRIAADRAGVWIAVWQSRVSLGGTLGTDDDILASVSVQECPQQPSLSCKETTLSGKARLKLADPKRGGRGRLSWKWGKGALTLLTDFGDPVTTSPFVLCLYEGTAGAHLLVHEVDIEPGGTCHGESCWKATSHGFRYRDTRNELGAIARLALRSGPDGRASIKLRGKGPTLAPPALPLATTPSVVLEFANLETGACWQGTYSTPDTSSERKFKAKSD